MSALEGPFAATCVLLALAGFAKLLRPIPTAGALAAARWPSSVPLVRLLGVGEIALGLAAVGTANRLLAALVGVAYAAFAVFVAVALRTGSPVQSCGCFGETTTPPSTIHLLSNLAMAGVAAAVAIGHVPSLRTVLSDQPAAGVPFLLLVAVAVQLLLAVLTDLPRALLSVRVHGALPRGGP
jgi:hypothetical protein